MSGRREFNLSGIVDIGTYNTILDPAVTLEDDSEEQDWDGFDFKKYMQKVKELAIPQLKKLLALLPKDLKIEYIDGTAAVDSPNFYNYRNDTLRFKVLAETDMSEGHLQRYIEAALNAETSKEFNATYNIYKWLRENCALGEFLGNES